MGFSTLATGASAAIGLAGGLYQAEAQRRQSKYLAQSANEQTRLNEAQASALVDNTLGNRIRQSRNADSRMGEAVADAAANNLLNEGSVRRREQDLASRLSDEINNNSNEALQEANSLRAQSAYNAWDTRNQAKNAKQQAAGSAIGSIGSLFGKLSKL